MKLHTFLCLLGTSVGATAIAESDDRRAGRLEVYGAAQYLSGFDATLSVDGVNADFDYDASLGGGFGFGYNLDRHWNLNFAVTGGTVETRTILDGTALDSNALLLNLDINVDYHLLSGPFTPFLTAGLNLTSVGDDLETSRVSLTYFQPELGVNGGAGIRWDFAEHWFLKVLYRTQWRTGIADLEGDHLVHGGTVAVGDKS
ncbi:MAG: outer membrane beta-barrel protein [Verrucomicrobiota bacterium]